MSVEIPIPGGRLNRGRLVRLGNFVLRPADEDPFIEQLIIEVGKVFTGIPKTFGRDSSGRLKLEWIEGESAETFDEDEERSRTRLLSVGPFGNKRSRMPWRCRSWDWATVLRYWAPLRNLANKKPAELLLSPWQRSSWILDGYSASSDLRSEKVGLLLVNQ
jgi:hypothetical protein